MDEVPVLVNGGLNLSELDGWWAEAYTSEVGWALGDGREHGNDHDWDATEAEALYERLEQEVIPEFYVRNDKGISTAWVRRMRESMAALTSAFSSNRSVIEYTEQHYLSAADAYRARAADKCAAALALIGERNALATKWDAIRFGPTTVETKNDRHFIIVEVYLNDINPDTVRVELYANASNGVKSLRQEMAQLPSLPGKSGGHVYSATVSSAHPVTDFTPRLMAKGGGLNVPLEAGWILWQK